VVVESANRRRDLRPAASVLSKPGVTLGRDYPEPLVDHGAARKRALEALKAVSKGQ